MLARCRDIQSNWQPESSTLSTIFCNLILPFAVSSLSVRQIAETTKASTRVKVSFRIFLSESASMQSTRKRITFELLISTFHSSSKLRSRFSFVLIISRHNKEVRLSEPGIWPNFGSTNRKALVKTSLLTSCSALAHSINRNTISGSNLNLW